MNNAPPAEIRRYDIAIIGLSGRFPGAEDLATFWRNLAGSVESVTFFSDDELLAAHVPPSLLNHQKKSKNDSVLIRSSWSTLSAKKMSLKVLLTFLP